MKITGPNTSSARFARLFGSHENNCRVRCAAVRAGSGRITSTPRSKYDQTTCLVVHGRFRRTRRLRGSVPYLTTAASAKWRHQKITKPIQSYQHTQESARRDAVTLSAGCSCWGLVHTSYRLLFFPSGDSTALCGRCNASLVGQDPDR